jgi:methionyl aminopeptidase
VLSESIKPGMKTKELDIIAETELKHRGAKPSFKGYRGYPASICVSINDEIVHGIPGDRVINEGDVVSLDFGVIYKGFQGDSAVTVAVGKSTPEARKLIDTTRATLERGIAAARDGSRLGDISAAIQEYAESQGYLWYGNIRGTASAVHA